MKAFRTLLFALLIIFCSGESFSVNDIIKYLHEQNYYNTVLEIKLYLGIDTAINMCKVFCQDNNNCDIVVKVYINEPVYQNTISSINSNKDYTINDLYKELQKIANASDFKNKIKSLFITAVNNNDKKTKFLIMKFVQNYKGLKSIYKTDYQILKILQKTIK